MAEGEQTSRWRNLPEGIKTLGKGPIIIGAAIVAGLFMAALQQATSDARRETLPERVQIPTQVTLPSGLEKLPSSYADVPVTPPRPAAPPPSAPMVDETMRRQAAELERRTRELEVALQAANERIEMMRRQPPPEPVILREESPAPKIVDEGRERAIASDIFFNNSAPATQGGLTTRGQGDLLAGDENNPQRQANARPGVAAAETPEFKPSPSPYLLSAGTIISASLVTAINSDLKGLVVAQVRENVYDTPTGNYLLIPQGARLIGRMAETPQFGEDRVGVTFERLIRPDGSSIRLADTAGGDGTGASGLADEVNNHYGQMVIGALLSATLNVGIRSTAGNIRGDYPSIGQDAAAAAGTGAGQVGNAFTQRAMARPPTITVAPGFSFSVIVGQDLVLPPWKQK
ncbi:TrbI/VirB10 family protein [Lacibacterium aquatile]|uniref:TrbI/VirB10 family protein n=1 Tax=Lacibacterium aquatile TaxID=1168082 RepID=A0ABW5DSE7_9PROT